MSFLSHHNQQNSGGINQQNNIDNSTHINMFNGFNESNKPSQDPNENVELIIEIALFVVIITVLYKKISPIIINYSWAIILAILVLAIINIIYAFKERYSNSEKIITIMQGLIPIVGQITWVKLNPQKKVTEFLKTVKVDNVSGIYKSITPIFNALSNGNINIFIYIIIQCILLGILYGVIIGNNINLYKNKNINIEFQFIAYLFIFILEGFSQYIIK